jgi:hypothetical protein
MAMVEMEERALRSAITHLTGRTRAFLVELEAVEGELRLVDDEWAGKLAEAVAAVRRGPGLPGSLTFVAELGTEALRSSSSGAAERVV